MIHIDFDSLPCGGLGMRLNGHAGWARAGETDPVCAAACMLAYTFENALRAYGPVTAAFAPGQGRVLAHPALEKREAARIAAGAVKAGCRALAQAYPAHVEVTAWE